MENLDISCRIGFDDAAMFAEVIEQGIDARLEAFTQSTFVIKDHRLFLSFHPDEVQILLRRLCERYDDNEDDETVGLWIEDIMMAQYGKEV